MNHQVTVRAEFLVTYWALCSQSTRHEEARPRKCERWRLLHRQTAVISQTVLIVLLLSLSSCLWLSGTYWEDAHFPYSFQYIHCREDLY